MSAIRKKTDDPYGEVTALVRELRELVGDQLHDLVIEREALGSQAELIRSIRHVGAVSKQVLEARGRQRQAQEMGLPVTPAVREEGEAMSSLRQAVMSLGAACGAWVVQMDFEERRPRIESAP